MQSKRKEVKRNSNKNRFYIILQYAGKLFLFWLAVGGLFAMIRMSSSVFAETMEEAETLTVPVIAQITPSQSSISLFADDAANTSSEQLIDYLKNQITITATYNDGTNGAVPLADITYTLSSGEWGVKGSTGAGYTYTVSVTDSAVTCNVQVEVRSITASISPIDDVYKTVDAVNGYPSFAQIGLPEKATIHYSAIGYPGASNANVDLVWSPEVPADFGKQATTVPLVFIGTVSNLPEWATIADKSVSVSINVLDKNNISDKLSVSIADWTYGENAKVPVGGTIFESGIGIEESFFVYSYDGTGNDGSVLTNSSIPPIKAGNYTVTASYEDEAQIGSVQKNFSIQKKEIIPTIDVTGVQKSFDFTNKVVGTKPSISFAEKVGEDHLSALAEFSYEDMEIGENKMLTANAIVLDNTNPVNLNYELAATTASARGASVRSLSSAAEMNRAVDNLKELIIDINHLTDAEQQLVAKAILQLEQLPEAEKRALGIKTIINLDTLQKQSLGNIVNVHVISVDGSIPVPTNMMIQGATLAAGAASSADSVDITITPQKSGDSTVKMEFLLSMKKNGTEQALLYPLLFTMKLPSSMDLSRLTLNHIMSNKTETVAFSNLGNQQITFSLSSFSKLQFIEKEVSSGSAGSSKKKKPHTESEEEKEYDYWQSVKRNLRKAKDGDTLTIDTQNYKEMPWYIMDILRDRKTLHLVVQWKGGKTFSILAGKAQPSDEKRVYWPLVYLEEIYNKEEIQPVINMQVPAMEVPQENKKPNGATGNIKPVTPSRDPQKNSTEKVSIESSTFIEKNIPIEENTPTEESKEEVHKVESFCLMDLLTGGRTYFGCYWCFIPIIIVVSIIGMAFIVRQEISNNKKKE